MRRDVRSYAFAIAALTLVLVTEPSLANRSMRQGTASSSAGGSILDGVFTSSQASRGQRDFERACASCHSAGEHTGRKFGARWAGTTMGDLFDLVSSTMPDGDPGSLKPEEYASILAFFLRASGYKEGESELPSEPELLKKIRIEPLPN